MRSTRRIVAAVVVVLVAGLWWVLRPRSAGRQDDGAGAPALAARLQPSHAVDDGDEAYEDAVVAEANAELLVRGVVVDEANRPVAAAVVSLSSRVPRQITTGPDGAFVFDGLRAVSYRLEAVKDDAWAGPVVVRAAASPEPVTLTLSAGSTLVLTVLDALARTPIAHAQVVLGGNRRSATSGADGVARLMALAPGRYRLAVKATGYAPAAPTLTMGAGAHAVEEQEVLLRRGASVSGTVIGADGAAVAGASVAVIDPSTPDALPLDFTRSGDGGAWTLPMLAAGTYRFTAMARGHPAATTSLLTLDGRTPRTGIVIRFDAYATLSGRVLTPERSPVPGATIRAVPLDMSEFPGLATRGRADEKGEFELPVHPTKLLVAAESSDAASGGHAVDLTGGGIQRGLVIVLDRTVVVSGTVVTRSGDPAPFAQVVAWPDASSGAPSGELRARPARSTTADAAGRFTLKGLAGTCQLVATRPGTPARPLAFAPGTRVEAGQTGVRLALAGGARLTGRVAFASGAVPDPFSISVADQPGFFLPGSTFRGTGGEFTIDEVSQENTRYLRVYGPGIVDEEVEVPPNPTAGDQDLGTLTVEAGRVLRGTVRDEHGRPVPGARVSAGHRLFGGGASLSATAPSVQRADAGADGCYELRGMATGSLGVMAEAPRAGRSEMVVVAAGAADAVVDLVLRETGSLEGTVERGGIPVATQVMVSPEGQDTERSPTAMYMVESGRDGAYRFDTLAPGRYVVRTQRLNRPPAVSMAATAEVQITAGSTQHRDLELPSGATVTVRVRGQAGAGPRGVTVLLALADVSARTTAELGQLVLRVGRAAVQGTWISRGESAAVFEDVPAGPCTVCGFQTPASVGDLSGQAVTCAPVVVGTEEVEATLMVASAPR